MLSTLTPYEHLHRLFRFCSVHGYRNIRETGVPEEVRNLMRSLICIEHHDWSGTIRKIEVLGGKAGSGLDTQVYLFLYYDAKLVLRTDWVKNKVQSKFAFEAMCWERSKIPKVIWQAGDSSSNIVESVHANVNADGVSCTLVGGLRKGQYFDAVRMEALMVGSYDYYPHQCYSLIAEIVVI